MMDAASLECCDAEGECPRKVSGYAAVFNQQTVIGYDDKGRELREVIRPGAFDYAISNNQDVRCLYEHDFKLILGRVRAGTLRLAVDDYGLHFDCDLADTSRAEDLTADIQAGNVSGASFSYLPRPGGETITKGSDTVGPYTLAEITSADLYDVSPTSIPAYAGTAVVSRSLEQVREAEQAATEKRRIVEAYRSRIASIVEKVK
jgi:HK97 family phage prohead protease